jgi:glutathione S-transferase
VITLHHLLMSQSERIVWLLEELDLPYALKSYPRDANGLADPAFLALNPLGQAPVLQDGDVTMGECLAIATYIFDLYGDGGLRIAPGQAGYADYVYWFHYANAGLQPQAVLNLLAHRFGGGAGANPGLAMLGQRMSRHLGMIEARLAAHDWLAGERFTAADLMCQFPFGTMAAFAPLDLGGHPAIRAWLGRISARPAYQRAMRKAGHEHDPAQPPGV